MARRGGGGGGGSGESPLEFAPAEFLASRVMPASRAPRVTLVKVRASCLLCATGRALVRSLLGFASSGL